MHKKTLRTLTLLSALSLLSACSPQTAGQSTPQVGDIASMLLQGLTGQGNSTAAAAGKTGASILDHLLNKVMAAPALTPQELAGTWTYKGSNCFFESENLLAQAGGIAIASQVESKIDAQLAKLGIQAGTTRFTFTPDGNFTLQLGQRQFAGTYVFDPKTRTLQLSALMGLFSLQPQVVRSAQGISLLFEADKLLSLAKTTASVVGKADSTVGLISSVMGSYKGMRIGLKLSK